MQQFSKGVVNSYLLIFLVILGIIIFFILSAHISFKQDLFGSLYQRTPAKADLVTSTGFEVGLDAGAQRDTSRVNPVDETATSWVRLNFIGSDWTTPGSTDIAIYNSIINAYLSKNIKIIGLIGAESVPGGYDRTKPDEFTSKFVTTADAIVSQFGDRVKVYGLFNEPNDWAGGASAQIAPSYLRYLEAIYRQIKITRGKTDIYLISGPLFSFDLTTAADYLQQVYQSGISTNWEAIKLQTGSYPLDGVGYHIYVSQGMGDVASVENKINQNLSAIASIINSYDPGKKVWITEFAWGTGVGRVSEDVQAANLEKAYSIFKNNSLVKIAMWFSLVDWNEEGWGLIRGDGVRKKAWISFAKTARGNLLVGDLNRTNKVDIVDLSIFLSNWQKQWTIADINVSGRVDLVDLSIFLSNWGAHR